MAWIYDSDSSSDWSMSSDETCTFAYAHTVQPWFYAVAVGRTTGIFTDWNCAMNATLRYPGNKFKKFSTRWEAEQFLDDEQRCRDDSYGYEYSSTQSSEEEEGIWYYAVAVGRNTGIYQDWQDAVAQTHGFSGFRMKKFLDYADAEKYLDQFQIYSDSESDESEEQVMEDEDLDLYYGVVVGRTTGIFTNWDHAMQHTSGYSYAKFKRFSSFGEAREFLRGFNLDVGNPLTDSNGWRTWFAYSLDGVDSDGNADPKHPETLVAFCDGSALRNGKRDCKAAFACIFPHHREWDVVECVNDGYTPTNNRAEYLAALEALKRANLMDYWRDEELYIYSDSSVLIDTMTKWVYKWENNGWQTTSGSSVQNRDLVERLLDAEGDRRVVWRHVKAHTGALDWASYWNNVADNRARATARADDGLRF